MDNFNIGFDLNLIDDNAFTISDFKGRDLKLLSTLEIFQFCKANKRFREPGISAHELQALHKNCLRYEGCPATIVETGMCFGVTTRYFALRNLRNGGKFYSFELNVREAFKEEMIDVGLWDIITKKGHSIKDSFEENSIDILFIDSEHAMSDALGEYMRFRSFLTGDALIGFHDTDACLGVKKAIEVILVMDDLELVGESSNLAGMGIKIFKMRGMGVNQHKRNLGVIPYETF